MRRIVIGLIALAPLVANAQAKDPKIERLWKSKCASCHGADGKGQTEQGKKLKIGDMSAPAWQSKNTDADIKKAIVEGEGHKKNTDVAKSLKPEQIDALVGYCRSLAQK